MGTLFVQKSIFNVVWATFFRDTTCRCDDFFAMKFQLVVENEVYSFLKRFFCWETGSVRLIDSRNNPIVVFSCSPFSKARVIISTYTTKL